MVIGGASTQSRGIRPGKPVTIKWASGSKEYTAGGREILSWPLGQYGPLLGYPSLFNPLTQELVHALSGAMQRGEASLGSYAPDIETSLAEKLCSIYSPYLNDSDAGVRFFSNGTDATQVAIALARYHTSRRKIVSIGYHGGSSPVFSFPPQNGGVLVEESDQRLDMPLSPEVLSTIDYFTAAVIVEVPCVRDEQETEQLLRAIQNQCTLHGARFIMDEIVTGFRYGMAGATGFYNLHPDAICLGKAMSTYGKVSAIIESREVIENLASKVFASYTYNDHPLGFLDALMTVDAYRLVRTSMDRHIQTVSDALTSGLNSILGDLATTYGHPSRTVTEFKDSVVGNLFMSRMIDEYNVLVHRPNFVTLAHSTQDVERTLDAAEKVRKTL